MESLTSDWRRKGKEREEKGADTVRGIINNRVLEEFFYSVCQLSKKKKVYCWNVPQKSFIILVPTNEEPTFSSVRLVTVLCPSIIPTPPFSWRDARTPPPTFSTPHCAQVVKPEQICKEIFLRLLCEHNLWKGEKWDDCCGVVVQLPSFENFASGLENCTAHLSQAASPSLRRAILSICRGRRANMQKYAKVFVIQKKPSFVLRESAKLLRQLFKQFIHLSFLHVLSSTSVVTAFPK